MAKVWQKALLRILILTILFTSAGTFVLWDYHRVDKDFSALMALLQDTRYRAITKNKTLVVRFVGCLLGSVEGLFVEGIGRYRFQII